jgi:hypothetical protein
MSDTMRTDPHYRLVRAFEEAEEASEQPRTEAERARDYYDGKQLTPEQIKALKKRKQPIVVENLIRPKVDYLCGLERQTRTDPKAYPRTAMHDQDAEAVTDALRYVADDCRWDVKRSNAFQHMLVEGFGGVEIFVKQNRDGFDPDIKTLDWDRVFYDPHSCRPDFSDASYIGYVTWMDYEEAKRRWPDREDVLQMAYSKGYSAHYETYEDKPKFANWTDPTRNRIRIITIYDNYDGEWQRGVYTLSGFLEDLTASPFVDEEGNPECAIILQSGYVDRDNDRYGLVRDYMTLQDEVNKRRMKFLHLSNTRQVRISPATGMKPDEARRELTRPDGVVVADQGEVEIIGTGDMASGHFSLLAEAKQAIQAVGPNATMQGKAGEGQSGRAIMALQQGGMTEVAPLMDALRDFNLRVYRAVWNRIRQFWTAERWVRVTDDEANVRFVGLNTTKGKLAALKIREALKAGKIDGQQAQQFGQQIAMDPTMQQPANVLADVDADIVIDEQIDAPTLQMEQFEQLSGMLPSIMQTRPDRAPQLIQLMVEASSLRDKDKLRTILEEEPQQPDPMQQQAAMMAMAAQQEAIAKTKSETARNTADAQAKLAKIQNDQANTQIDAFEAGMRAA